MRSAFDLYDDIYRELHGGAPPERLIVLQSDADVLSPARGFMAGFDYTLQLQVGCPGGCHFCYVPAGFRLAPAEMRGPMWGYRVRRKTGAVAQFARRLEAGVLADKTIYWSGVTDPYAAPSDLTRPVWEALLAAPPELRPRRIAVQSRFNVARDAELIGEYARTTRPADGGPAVVVSLSVGTDKDALIRAWERSTPLFAQRMGCIEKLRAQGIRVVVTLSPFALWNDLTDALVRLREMGVAYLTVLFLKEKTPSANTPSVFLAYVRSRDDLRVLLDRAWQEERLAEMQVVFGEGRVIEGQPGFASLALPDTPC